MDSYEATKKVFTRIQSLDPENSSKIMGLLLIQDHGEKEMIRLAFGPESLLQSVVFRAKQELGISPNTPLTPSSAQSSNPFSISRQTLNGLKIPPSLTVPSLGSPLSSPSSWVPSNDLNLQNPDDKISPNDLIDEIQIQLQEQLSFLNDPPQEDDPMLWGPPQSDVSDDLAGAGLGWKPCLYYARGFCKNGASCRFLHGAGGLDSDSGSGSFSGGSCNKIEVMDQCHQLLRSKSMQHQKMMAASQLMSSRANSFSYSGNKPFNLLIQQQQNEYQRAAAGLMMGEDMFKLSRSRLSRNEFLMNGGGQVDLSYSSRQIYLTFPADSTFREEDVSNYFSIFGPVQDVRIPYQQKRMFGFVTFVYPDTVKMILAKGNPHFVCESRVLVKPYKEKGKIPDKFRKQQHFSPCNSPTALDPRDPFENQLASRMMYNNPEEVLWRRKVEEQAELQQALELHSRRLINLQLDAKKSQHHRALSAGAAPFPSPDKDPIFNQHVNATDCASQDGAAKEYDSQISQAVNDIELEKEGSGKEDQNSNESPLSNENCSLPDSLEHNLPDSPFASPTKSAAKHAPMFATSNLDLSASFKSCYFQMPRLSAGPGAIGM